MDFSKPDAVEPAVLNRAIWYSVRGFDTPYPGDGRVLRPSEVAGGRINAVTGDPDDGVASADRAHASVLAAQAAARPGRPPAAQQLQAGDATVTCRAASLPAPRNGVPRPGPVVFAVIALLAGMAVVWNRKPGLPAVPA
jgi:hypothetical protein